MRKFPNLESEIKKRRIKKVSIANALDISSQSLQNKLKGVTPFTWEEVVTMQEKFFPDMSKEYLMKVAAINEA